MPILGLVSTESTSTERFTNIRRKVFYKYPQGAAPLVAITSMLKEEETDDPEFTIYEKYLAEAASTTKTQGSSKGPFRLAADAVDGADPFLPVLGTTHTLYVGSNAQFRLGDVLRINGLIVGGTTVDAYTCVITALGSAVSTTATDRVTVLPVELPTGISTGFDNGTSSPAGGENVSKEVIVVGSSFAQGATNSAQGVYTLPFSVTNYCQIFRTPFSITATQMVTSAKYDETGPYKDMAKENSLAHMIRLENAFIFGKKYKTTTTLPSGETVPQYLTGGILWYLEQYEAADSVYRGGSGAAAVTADTDDNKRIIANSAGTINVKTYDTYLERLFRNTNNVANEKLVLCGSGFLKVVNQMYESRSCLDSKLPMTDTFGWDVVKHTTPFGTVYYKSHPLFNRNSTLRYNALFLDVQNLKYRYVIDRDTKLFKDRGANDFDGRRDEWLTEAGLELIQPDSCMYMQNVRDYTP